MKDIYEYILLSQEERQKHLRLEEPCIDRGGEAVASVSFYYKGMLAHFLDTTIPTGKKIHLCHACYNGRCGNPVHLYWGTPRENYWDAINNGTPTLWNRVIRKYGEDGARRLNAHIGNTNASTTKKPRKPMSDTYRLNLSKAAKLQWAEGRGPKNPGMKKRS